MEFNNIKSDYLLVLDAHGVVFNNPLKDFFKDLAKDTQTEYEDLWGRWREKYRTPFWEGKLTSNKLWTEIAPEKDPQELEQNLLLRYTTGPIYDSLINSSRPACLFSNHQSQWLLPRLKKFRIEDRFEHIIVSDKIKAAKPSNKAFDALVKITGTKKLFLIDDSPYNIEAAIAYGIQAYLQK